jgi:hypothetical protein
MTRSSRQPGRQYVAVLVAKQEGKTPAEGMQACLRKEKMNWVELHVLIVQDLGFGF